MAKVLRNQTGIQDDKCAILTRELQNSSINSYDLYNPYFTKDCGCDNFDDIVIENNLLYRDGYGYTSGCTVDTDSDVRYRPITHAKGRIPLCTRQFTGVPNINKGGLVPNVESRLKNADDTSDITRCDRVTEKDFDRFIPFVGCLGNSIQDPEHIIEKWTRGGSATRQIAVSSEYLSKCGFEQVNNNWVRKK